MDPVALTYYAVVCGLLSVFTPRTGGLVLRLVVGAAVGIVAAGVLPWLHSLIG